MEYIELLNVEYGDCTVLGGKNSILMVDCGSINQKLREPEMDISEVFRFISERYRSVPEKHFLLSHYHRDHLCGLMQILSEEPQYFDRVYIPYLPHDGSGASPLLDFAVFAKNFLPPESNCSQVNVSCLGIFSRLGKTVGADRIFTLSAGSSFLFDAVPYKVLSPAKENFSFPALFTDAVEQLNICLSNPFLTGCEREFMERKSAFTQAYNNCLDAFMPQERKSPEKLRLLIERLESTAEALDSMKEEINLSPAANDIRMILEQPITKQAYTEAANAASVVFHNIREKEASFDDILMTGDLTEEIMNEISPELYGGYYAVKAPHHGTKSGYCSVFRDIGISHLLISNGEYHAGGDIAEEYIDMECIKHCTGTCACKWFKTSGSCCNRLNYCYDQPGGSGLSIKCPATKFSAEIPRCSIYVTAPGRSRGCFCDNGISFT